MEQLKSKFEQAFKSGHIIYLQTQFYQTPPPLSFQIRFLPSLQTKPTHLEALKDKLTISTNTTTEVVEKKNPFLPPDPNLIINEHFTNDHSLILNKFCVQEHHSLLISKEFRSQAEGLKEIDFCAIFKFFQDFGSEWLGFFNCGPNSGYSQPHLHIQFLPLPGLKQPPVHYDNFQKVFPRLEYQSVNLPEFEHEKKWIETIYNFYQKCLQKYKDGVTGESYNLLITKEWIIFVPRTKEFFIIPDTNEKISVNALGYAGMLLVKNEPAFNHLKDHYKEISQMITQTGLLKE